MVLEYIPMATSDQNGIISGIVFGNQIKSVNRLRISNIDIAITPIAHTKRLINGMVLESSRSGTDPTMIKLACCPFISTE